MTPILFAIMLPVALAIGYWLVKHAPEGYQDALGFHFGRALDSAR